MTSGWQRRSSKRVNKGRIKSGGRRERPRDRERGTEELTGRDETSRPLPLVMATP